MESDQWDEEDWSTLIYTIQRGNCILMLGPEAAVEDVDGRDRPCSEVLAHQLADKIGSKTQSWNLDPCNLAQVAHWYCMETGRTDLEVKVSSFYNERRTIANEMHMDLATLPFSLIITSTPDTMFCEALKKGGKPPIIERYNFRGQNPDIVPKGSVEKPLVFYLYGTVDEPESMVLTENDLLDFLMAVVLKNPPLPNNIMSELRNKNNSLLFLGFGFKNWYLRILLRVLQGRGKESRSFALEPHAPGCAEDYESAILFYRKSDYKIQIHHQEIHQFVKELKERFTKSTPIGTATSAGDKPQLPGAPTVFICHASEDKEQASRLYEQLEAAGLRPWLDKENLRGGDLWDQHIERAIKKEVDYFIVLQSHALAEKEVGYVNKEIRMALDHQMNFRFGLRFIIPVKVEEAPLLEELEALHAIDLSNQNSVSELVRTINRDQQRRKRN